MARVKSLYTNEERALFIQELHCLVLYSSTFIASVYISKSALHAYSLLICGRDCYFISMALQRNDLFALILQ